jgi:hypothetical protein
LTFRNNIGCLRRLLCSLCNLAESPAISTEIRSNSSSASAIGSGNTKAADKQAKRAATIGKQRRRRERVRRKFAVSGEESILAFVKSKSNPIGKEIQKHWANEGRAGAAANLISKLVKAKRLKRTPLKDERGSRYSLV